MPGPQSSQSDTHALDGGNGRAIETPAMTGNVAQLRSNSIISTVDVNRDAGDRNGGAYFVHEYPTILHTHASSKAVRQCVGSINVIQVADSK